MNPRYATSTMAALVLHFFSHSFRRVTTWLIFVVAPIAGVMFMYTLLDMTGIGLLVFSLMLEACIVAVLSLKEKESGIYRRILAAPASSTMYTVSLFVAVYVVLALETVLVLAAVYLLVPLDGDVGFGGLAVLLLCFGVAAAGFGVMLTAFASDSTQGAALANVGVIFSSFLGGCFWPVDIMPDGMQRFARVFPQTWANLAVGRLSAGESLRGIGEILLLLIVYGVAFLLVFGLMRRRANQGV